MPGPDITRPRNSRVASFIFLLICVLGIGVPIHGRSEGSRSRFSSTETQTQSQTPPGQSSQEPASPAPAVGSSPQQKPSDEGTFVIRKDVDEVILHATVSDD